MKKYPRRRLMDGLQSMLTSLGERVSAINYTGTRGDIADRELLAMYKHSWVVKKFIDKTADDMLKVPREITGGLSDETKKRAAERENSLNVYSLYREALTWSSLLGDALMIAITDGEDAAIASPLDRENEHIVRFLVLSKGEYQPGNDVINDIASEHFGSPRHYTVTVGQKQVNFHHTRCHRIRLGKQSFMARQTFGTSDIQAAYQAIKIFDTAILSTGDTIQEANVDVMFLSGLNQKIAAGQEDEIVDYARMVKETKSSTGLLLMDAGDVGQPSRYEQKTAQFTGLSEVITKMANVLAGALDLPAGSLTEKGIVQLSNATDSDSETMAATPKAVKSLGAAVEGMKAGRLLNIQSFTRSGTYIPTPGTQKIRVKCWGAGGGGGGTSKQNRGSVSGAAGAYAEALLDATSFSSVSVEVGTGGAASADSVSQDGGDGGGSYFGAHVTCEGGSGGIVGKGLAKGGEPAGGNVMMVFGQSGQGGTYASGFLINGVGGASFGGYNALPHVSKRGDDGSFPGGGGAMGSYVDENTHYASGKGGDGLIIVEEYS